MSYQVIARKWRPQTFDEVVFQEHISKTLKNSIVNGRISHAYLFSGPRGVGKTTMARILSKALNCAQGPTAAPCGVCDNCAEIKSGASFDVIEIDGASNRGIEDIRELRENVNFAPIRSRYKIYIIDEVHMLTREAFNALLKTLEEPPPHVVFIFATTEFHQIPETILSRCQKFFFKKISVEAVAAHLKHIVAREGYRITDRALYSIARASEGSMRDAQSLLDQTISFSGKGKGEGTLEISEEDALAILGIVSLESYARQLGFIADQDQAGCMQEVERVITLGVDIPRYLAGFIEAIRILRFLRNKVSLQEILGLSPDENDLLQKLADRFYDEELSLIYKIASDLQGELKFSFSERISLEMALLDMASVKGFPSLSAIVNKLENGGSGNAPAPRVPDGSGTRQSPAPPRAQSGTGSAQSGPLSEQFGPIKAQAGTAEKAPEPQRNGAVPEVRVLQEKWAEFLNGIQNGKQFLYSVLKPARIEFSGRNISIRYPGGSDHSYYARILDTKKVQYIREELSRMTGCSIEVTVGFMTDPAEESNAAHKKPSPPAGPKVHASPNAPDLDYAAPLPDAEMMKKPEVDEHQAPNPTVDKIKTMFHGEIIEKDDKSK